MKEIPRYAMFQKIDPITKGWSSDEKYRIETGDGERLLLRITDISHYDRKEREFQALKRLTADGLPVPQSVDIGVCDDGRRVYSLVTWCEGEEAEAVLPKLPETMQYVLGVTAGRVLRRIHEMPAPADQEPWDSRFNRKIDGRIAQYRTCGVKMEGDDQFIAYIEANRHLLQGRPQCFRHGDYHVGNMLISPEGELKVTDFNRSDYGDPWEEFDRIVWSAAVSPHFATGQIHGYFNGHPPEPFFRLLALYICCNTLSSIPWAISYGEREVAVMQKQAQDVLVWFDGMNRPVPTWYLADFYVQYIGRVPCKLKAPFDFSFLRKYGEVFRVFDDQDSGNLCFGVRKGERKYFVKFAGAPTEQYAGDPKDAVARLRAAVQVYRDLAHPHLIRLVDAEEVGGGYAAVFEWVDGACWGRMYPLSREKFLQLSDPDRLEGFDAILDFHIHVAERGYVAIDFYDGCVMYDFGARKTYICDVDFYAKRPYVNTMGRMWGSSRFMSPEEFTSGAVIDEVSNVYAMGAAAFELFGGGTDRS